MSHPARNAYPESIVSTSRIFFITTKTHQGQRLLQSERNASLLIDVLRSNVVAGKYTIHDFVVMPNHLHLLLTVHGDLSVEKAMQFVKGGFSYRLQKEFGYRGEVWQRGFSEVRIWDRESFTRHREYIIQNPVKSGLVRKPEDWPFCYTHLVKVKTDRLASETANPKTSRA